jgi:hypothetical protein
VGVGPLGAFGGYVLMPVMNERGLFWNLAPSGLTRWALLPGNAQETWGRELLADLPCFRESSSPARKGSERAWSGGRLAWSCGESSGIPA